MKREKSTEIIRNKTRDREERGAKREKREERTEEGEERRAG